MIEVILSKLEKVRSNGRRKWTACCPAHNDRSPSLALTELDDGRILMHCFAGCEVNDVLTAIGLNLTDLYPDGALNNNLKGWAQMMRDHDAAKAKKDDEKRRDAELYLAICDGMRKERKLTPAELEKERAMYIAVRRINENTNRQ